MVGRRDICGIALSGLVEQELEASEHIRSDLLGHPEREDGYLSGLVAPLVQHQAWRERKPHIVMERLHLLEHLMVTAPDAGRTGDEMLLEIGPVPVVNKRLRIPAVTLQNRCENRALLLAHLGDLEGEQWPTAGDEGAVEQAQ